MPERFKSLLIGNKMSTNYDKYKNILMEHVFDTTLENSNFSREKIFISLIMLNG